MRLLLPCLAALTLSSCDLKEPETQAQGKHQTTATVQIFQSPLLPKSDRFLRNQIALLKTNLIAKIAAKTSGISSEIISSSLEIQPIANSDLLTISSHANDQGQPKKVIQAILDAYRDHRKKIEAELAQENLLALDQELSQQSDSVQTLRKELAPLIRSYGIPYFDDSSKSPLGRTEKDMYRSAKDKLKQFKTHRDETRTNLEELEKRTSLELVKFSAALDLPENQVTFYYEQYLQANKERRQKREDGLGEIHPEIKALVAKSDKAFAAATKETKTLKDVLKIKLELIEKQITKMTSMIESRDDRTENLNEYSKKYDQVKEAYENARNELRALKEGQEERRSMLKTINPILVIHGWE